MRTICRLSATRRSFYPQTPSNVSSFQRNTGEASGERAKSERRACWEYDKFLDSRRRMGSRGKKSSATVYPSFIMERSKYIFRIHAWHTSARNAADARFAPADTFSPALASSPFLPLYFAAALPVSSRRKLPNGESCLKKKGSERRPRRDGEDSPRNKPARRNYIL